MYYVMHNDPLEQWHETRQEHLCADAPLRERREWLCRWNSPHFNPIFIVAKIPYSLFRDFGTNDEMNSS